MPAFYHNGIRDQLLLKINAGMPVLTNVHYIGILVARRIPADLLIDNRPELLAVARQRACPKAVSPELSPLSVRADGARLALCPNREGAQNPHPIIMRTLHRGESQKMGKPPLRNPQSQIRNRLADEFCLTSGGFCRPPEAKFRQFRPTRAHELVSRKRLAQASWGETGRISPHQKKKKYS